MYEVKTKALSDGTIMYVGYVEDGVGYDIFMTQDNKSSFKLNAVATGYQVEMREFTADNLRLLAKVLDEGHVDIDFDGLDHIEIWKGNF